MSLNQGDKRKGPSWRILLWVAVAAFIGLTILSTAKELGLTGSFGVNVGVVQFELEAQEQAQLSNEQRPQVDDTVNASSVEPIPVNNDCYSQYGFVMPWAEWWYPANNWWIMYHSLGGFEVSDPYYYGYSYPDPGGQWPRNQWITLEGTPLSVCVDVSNFVYARYG